MMEARGSGTPAVAVALTLSYVLKLHEVLGAMVIAPDGSSFTGGGGNEPARTSKAEVLTSCTCPGINSCK